MCIATTFTRHPYISFRYNRKYFNIIMVLLCVVTDNILSVRAQQSIFGVTSSNGCPESGGRETGSLCTSGGFAISRTDFRPYNRAVIS